MTVKVKMHQLVNAQKWLTYELKLEHVSLKGYCPGSFSKEDYYVCF